MGVTLSNPKRAVALDKGSSFPEDSRSIPPLMATVTRQASGEMAITISIRDLIAHLGIPGRCQRLRMDLLDSYAICQNLEAQTALLTPHLEKERQNLRDLVFKTERLIAQVDNIIEFINNPSDLAEKEI
jgi:hypothetical protein